MTAQLALAWDAAERGMQSAADHAESETPGWGEQALRHLADYARCGHEFTSEQFRAHARAIGFDISVPKAMGQVFRTAAKRGLIRKVGYGVSAERHMSPCPRWVRA